MTDFLDVEVIIVSNGHSVATDLKDVNVRNARIVRSKNRLPMTLNWSYGLDYATCDWTSFLGDDDLYLNSSGKMLKNVFRNTNCLALKFLSVPFLWNNYNPPAKLMQQAEDKEIDSIHCLPHPKGLWWKDHPRYYPTSNADSPIRTSLLKDLKKEGAIFTGISPDWQIGAVILNRQICFEKYEYALVGSGTSPYSSISILKNKTMKGSQMRLNNYIKSENLLNQKISLHPELKNIDSNFPTTWVAKMDSLLRGRQDCGRSTWQVKFVRVWDSFDTTPKFTFKVLRYYLKRYKISALFFFPLAIIQSLIKHYKLLTIILMRRQSINTCGFKN